MTIAQRIAVIGGGLAGCEAAWQAARQGADVDLYEMRPLKSGPAHHTGNLAELVCSNSLRGAALENAVGLLKAELAALGSVIVGAAHEAAVPAGGALAVDRERFALAVQRRIEGEPRIAVRRGEVLAVDLRRPTIVACGPLPSDALLQSINNVIRGCHPELPVMTEGRRSFLHYYDAASPIVAADSIDETVMYRKSRYEKGDGDDYLNIPLDREAYARLVRDLRTLPRHEAKAFETKFFEGCLPIEEMADRGDDVLRYGPLKPVGLRDPRTGRTPYAVVQLRKENREGSALNLVGFQTRLTWPAQKEAFARLPGLANAEWLRLGVMHRNTFIDAPRLLGPTLELCGRDHLWFAGQITGAEGYVEAAACGAIAGITAARAVAGLPTDPPPFGTALGAVLAHLHNAASPDFQPANVTWAYFPPLQPEEAAAVGRDKRARRRRLAERALVSIETWKHALDRAPTEVGNRGGVLSAI